MGDEVRVEHDAWKQMDDLVERFTREIAVRSDLVVMGLACERNVRLTLIETDYDRDVLDKRRERHHSTQRNVATMRQLAQALLDACDFVDQANPEWASHRGSCVPTHDD